MRGIVEVIAEDDVRHITDNAVTAAFLGLTPDAMKNKRGSELGEPRDILRMWIGYYTQSQKSKKPVAFEYVDKRGGNEAWLHTTVSYLGTPPHGYPRFAYVVLDITERKRAEEKIKRLFSEVTKERDWLSALINSISDEIWFADTSKRFVLANPSALREFGLTSENHVDVEKFSCGYGRIPPGWHPSPGRRSPAATSLSPGRLSKTRKRSSGHRGAGS